MKKNSSVRLIAAAWVAGGALTGCLTPSGSDGAADLDTDKEAATPVAIEICSPEDVAALPPRIEIGSTAIDGDNLLATVIYGGCAKADYRLCWNGSSEPTVGGPDALDLYLTTVADGEASCDFLVVDELSIDLSPLAAYYHDNNEGAGGSLAVHLNDSTTFYDFASYLPSELARLAAKANYMSEGDATARLFEAPFSGNITRLKFTKVLKEGGYLGPNQAFQFWSKRTALWFLEDAIELSQDNNDPVSAAAWEEIAGLIAYELTSVRGAIIGPANADGSLREDSGTYTIVIFGKDADGNLLGITIDAVWT